MNSNRQEKVKVIVCVLKRFSEIGHKQLVEETKLSSSVVSAILKGLEKQNIIKVKRDSSKGGRGRSYKYSLVNKHIVIGDSPSEIKKDAKSEKLNSLARQFLNLP